MAAFIEAAYLDCLVPGSGVTASIGNNTFALFRIDGAIYALEAWCLRCGARLAEGHLEGLIVACRGCDWRYEITTGSVEGIRALRLHTYNVELVGGQVIIADAQ